jgi:hypothetical protein
VTFFAYRVIQKTKKDCLSRFPIQHEDIFTDR